MLPILDWISNWQLALMAGGFGVIIGSFLNVYIYRFHTGKSLSGHSHCLSCGRTLRWYELIPLISYLFLRGRCRTCCCPIPPRYFLVELLTALLFAVVAVVFRSDLLEVVLLSVVMSVLVVTLVYDLYHMIIPDEFVAALITLAGARALLEVTQGGEWGALLVLVAAALLGSLFFYALWWFSKGRWLGFGDVKLVFPLGLLVGTTGVFSMIVLSFWIGAAISLALLALQQLHQRGQPPLRFLKGELTMTSAVPFAPFLIAGCLGVLLFGIDVLSLFAFTYGV